jgi:glycosyltransferase involved in cell wall biosynthesis
MRVVHVSPTYFADASVIGGGERYVSELSRCMSREADTTLVSFSSERRSDRRGDLKVELYPVRHFFHGNKANPIALRYLESVLRADVVHIHHLNTVVSDLTCLLAAGLRKPVFVTDYGGGGSIVLNRYLPLLRLYRRAIAYSEFGREAIPAPLQPKSITIKGGIDIDRFHPLPEGGARENTILFVGRILAHKGINYLVDGFRLLGDSSYRLRIVGRAYDQDFYGYLRQRAEGLNVEFVHDADDDRLLREYQTAKVTVLPSVHRTYHGAYTAVPELMGFTLLESQACGTPALCTDAGAMSEFVEEGRTGFVVAQNSAEAIATALRRVTGCPAGEYAELSRRSREWVAHLSWSEVVKQHLRVYSETAI